MFEWAYGGVNRSVPRNVGPECAYFLTPTRQITETIIVVSICLALAIKSYKYLRIPEVQPFVRKDRVGKRLLLVIMTLLWGMEIGFKFSSRTVIYVLNPCHVTTAIQIFLLAAPPSKLATALFRVHINLFNGPLLAFMFPETDSRLIGAEAALYWIQHGMMLVIPYYLLRLGGVYNVAPLTDFSWEIFSYSINLLYHFIVLQGFAIPAQVNLNHMLCPAIKDPFDGQWYRVASCFHQGILCPLLCKIFCVLATFFLTKFSLTKVKHSLEADMSLIKNPILGDESICLSCKKSIGIHSNDNNLSSKKLEHAE
ncbi:transmembrane protein 164 [Arctopsyche grandis]|uniref:transmembrane protein 164 n=1 Tax=Arctopsyche grandis TaxID=121162 RepID=UPI00406D8795